MASSSNIASNPKTRTSISLTNKIKILDRLSSGQTAAAVGREFSLNESTIRTIKRNESRIRKSVLNSTDCTAQRSVYIRDALMDKMERGLLVWIEDNAQKRIPLSMEMITQKALRLYGILQQNEPSSSKSKGTR